MIKKLLNIQNNFNLVDIVKTKRPDSSYQALEEQLLMDKHNIIYLTFDLLDNDHKDTLKHHMLNNYGAIAL